MIRRRFIQMMTFAGAGGVAALSAVAAEKKTVTYHVKGFYCVTCAVGVDALLERQKGVVKSQSDYKAATTTITFRPELVSEDQLKASIAEMGFHAE
jgi:copper chaperone CopZ